ncbi:MAG: preprotein translocase subunit SecG [Gemmatimonadetes bacterium]|nr:preprotein translocase subunit SecG [Gemmatimonadota bacterium]MYA64503.1 preprotein translocase subunit SecG [Gemmatimonadota bacterium]MYB99548.1 preprotein translocase subunit SecG [Gemmatimonadota bacterium]MYH52188.1 preprotein translocase subunit SecG [Gemmatimonadota bacterium]MYI46697.1 preprotein translocase subunit SecG [Gemmatimonadota bacterium]
MYGFLLTLLVLDGVVLGVVILLQAGKGGGLAAMGGGAAATEVLGGRQATSFLTRTTWIAGSAFMGLSLILAIMSSRNTAATSILQGIEAPPAPVPLLQQEEGASPVLIPGVEEVPPDAEETTGEEVPPPDGNESSSLPDS